MALHTSIIQVAIDTVQMIREAAKALAVLNDQSKPCNAQNAVQIDCLQLQLQLEVDVAKIMSWYSLWFIETDKSDDLFQALWGQAGHSAILSILQCIKKKCEALKYAVGLLSAQLDAQSRRLKPKRTNSWKKIQIILHLSTRGIAETHPSKDIHNDIHILTGYVDDLWAKSELHFRRLHGVPRGLRNRPDTANVNGRLEHAIATRSASSALYWSLQSCTTGLDLELDLLNHDQESDVFSDLFGWSDLKLSYHLHLQASTRFGTSIDLVADLYDDDGSPGADTFHVVDDIMLVIDPGLSDCCSKFVLRRPSTSEHGELSFLLSMKADLESDVDGPIWLDTTEGAKVLSSFNGVDLGSVQARVTLAYRVVESSLFLLGTPWLSHLKSDAIQASKITRLDQCYSLHISTSAIKPAPNSSFHQVEAAQIFQVGIILVEIALGRRILVNSPTVASNLTFMKHITAIEDTMGVPYKQACEFCLMQEGKEAWGPNGKYVANSLDSKGASEPVEMISLFYSEVFMRLRDVYTS